ncbi:lytic transglycosylase domain-containing protein [Sphingosinicella rhizophila]|uniref:Lytic transglycosylase domain-containing protein n=1 Tax=Sphingosinicella rhizophila TaxID=3050082 RepID=A0ABU3Q5D1_9SPHN|nr:lytic transglycosylase domain-containing protein [Sphingosinicella sp. GR2756]MDT9598623.1 lytic transglycosylase domain-containing protein [Sphingosinicella sp. GR2756]
MGPLSLLAAVLGVAAWQPEIHAASRRCGIPVAWIERVMRAESGGRTHLGGRSIRSRARAIGLMQLMPGTWAEMRAALSLGVDPDLPADNIIAGACYLRLMHDRFGYPGLFAAYNAGPARYGAYLTGRSRLPAETINYLAKVAGAPVALAPIAPLETPVTLFAIRRDPSPVASHEAKQDRLFAIRKGAQ